MKTLVSASGDVLVVGDLQFRGDGIHVNGEVWPAATIVVDAVAPGPGFRWTGSAFVPVPVPSGESDLAALRISLAGVVDKVIAEIYGRWMRFEAEYVAREAAARAFAAAGYEGECSAWVSSFAEPAKLSHQAAADRIISQADALRAALEQLGALRMQKYQILGAADEAAARAACNAILSNASVIEAGLQ